MAFNSEELDKVKKFFHPTKLPNPKQYPKQFEYMIKMYFYINEKRSSSKEMSVKK